MRFIVLACAAGALAIPGFVAAAPAAAPVTTHAGSFVNIGSHTGKGTASVRRGDRNRKLVLSRNFATDRRVIKLHMYLATDPTGTTFVDLGPMKRTGAQTFTIPARIKLAIPARNRLVCDRRRSDHAGAVAPRRLTVPVRRLTYDRGPSATEDSHERHR